MSNLEKISGFYGGSNTPCTIFIYTLYNGSTWYCVENSCNVNCTYEELENGCDVETVNDHNSYYSNKEIENLEQLEKFIDE